MGSISTIRIVAGLFLACGIMVSEGCSDSSQHGSNYLGGRTGLTVCPDPREAVEITPTTGTLLRLNQSSR